jgi:hypothetical protein
VTIALLASTIPGKLVRKRVAWVELSIAILAVDLVVFAANATGNYLGVITWVRIRNCPHMFFTRILVARQTEGPFARLVPSGLCSHILRDGHHPCEPRGGRLRYGIKRQRMWRT